MFAQWRTLRKGSSDNRIGPRSQRRLGGHHLREAVQVVVGVVEAERAVLLLLGQQVARLGPAVLAQRVLQEPPPPPDWSGVE